MTPFPETEIMTIKRLEVALRKMDLKLLKDGAYKLHEKYHGGFKFQYLDLLKEIFLDVSNNEAIPVDIKDILAPTIEDILSQNGINMDKSTSPYESLNQDRVSSLTSLSYKPQINQSEEKLSAFDAFSSNKPNNNPPPQKFFTQSPFSAEPFKEFNIPSTNPPLKEDTANTLKETNETIQEEKEVKNIATIEQTVENTPALNEEQQSSIQKDNGGLYKTKTVSIFYFQDSSADKTKNILKLRELLKQSLNDSISLFQTAKLISEINLQADTNVSELKGVLEHLKNRIGKVNLITNSQSSNFFDLFLKSNLSYSMFDFQTQKNVNLIPLFGLSNLFECSQCTQKHLDTNSLLKPIVLQCPKCKSPMFADFYASDSIKGEINTAYYNSALTVLSKSTVWLLIHPLLDQKITFNLLTTALEVSNSVDEIYVIDKDINVRENCKNIFSQIKPDAKVNIQVSALEDFFNLV